MMSAQGRTHTVHAVLLTAPTSCGRLLAHPFVHTNLDGGVSLAAAVAAPPPAVTFMMRRGPATTDCCSRVARTQRIRWLSGAKQHGGVHGRELNGNSHDPNKGPPRTTRQSSSANTAHSPQELTECGPRRVGLNSGAAVEHHAP